MKTIHIILFSIAFIVNCWSQNLLNQPQKIVIDAERNRYIVSMWGGGGDLVQIDSLGNQSYFVENAGMVDGMQIVGDTLYGSGPYPSGTVRGYNLETGELVMDLDLSGDGVQHLSSFVVDSSGIIYTSERFGTRIFKINPKTREYWVFAEGNGIDKPNGLLYEPENNRLLVCLDQPNPPILAISLTDSTVSTVVSTNLEGSDGIAKDKYGNYYITGFELSGIYKFDPGFNGEPELFFEGDYIIYPTYNEEHHSLLVTYYFQNGWDEVFLENNLLNNPESAVYDSIHFRYLVSNWADGSIVQIDSNGIQSYFVTGHGSINGIYIAQNKVFAGCSTKVKGFDLDTKEMIMDLAIPGAINLNDVTADNAGNLYLTDFNKREIIKINIQSQAYTTFVSGLTLQPNGILFDDPNNRLLLCSFGYNIPILEISLEDSSVSTVANTTLAQCDGFTKDDFGNYYISSWATKSIYRFNSSFNDPPELIYTSSQAPVDISYNSVDEILIAPIMFLDTMVLIPISPVSVDDNNESRKKTNLEQNYPNPFNSQTTIRYEIPELSFATLRIYDVVGNEIKTLVSEEKPAGNYNTEWNAKGLPSGIYFYKIQAGNFTETKKMVLMK